MIKIFLIHLILQCTFKFACCGATLDQQNTEKELDPLYDASTIAPKREHDKRTIFSSGVQNYGWAKHIGHHPSGFRYVIGYGPVDLKYVPVLRQPIKLFSHLHSHRSKWPPKFTKPLPSRPIHDHGWKPNQSVVKPFVVRPVLPVVPLVNPIVKPVVPIVKPVGAVVKPVVPIVAPAPSWPNKFCQDEWKQKPVIANPVPPLTPVNVVHFQPGVKPFTPPHLVPAPPPVAPVYPIRPIFSVQQLVPTQPIGPAHPVVVPNPWVPSVKPSYPIVPQQQFFQVSKPNLPVLPLGATFPSPILQQTPTGSGIIVQNKPPIHHNPRPLVEYHGTHNFVPVNGFINFPKLTSIQPQYAPQFLQLHQPTPASSFIQPSGLRIQQNPLDTLVSQLRGNQQSVHFPQTQQQLPQVTNFQQLHQQGQQISSEQYQPPTNFQQFHQQGQPITNEQYQPPTSFQQLPQQEQEITNEQYQPPTNFQQLHHQGQQITDEQYQPPLGHGQLPLEGENAGPAQDNTFISSNHPNLFSHEQDTHYYSQNDVQQEQFHSSNSIQPGRTDVQTPLYLPPHTGFNPQVENFNGFNLQFSSSQRDGFGDFKPSPSLEASSNNMAFNRREDVATQKIEDNNTDQTENN